MKFKLKIMKRKTSARILLFVYVAVQALQFPVQVFAQDVASESATQQILPSDEGRADYYEDYSLQEKALDALSEPSNPSATIKNNTPLKALLKKNIKGDESVTITIDNTSFDKLKFKLFDFEGNEAQADIEVISDADPVVVKIHPGVQYKPGRYRIKVEDQDNNVVTKDFTWGVLAINTNKSVYTPDEIATIEMAVLDEVGDMVCNAEVTLKITDPKSNEVTFSTEDGTVIVNPQCYTKDMTIVPDYQAQYPVGGDGVYSLDLSATTKNGTFSIKDSLVVQQKNTFDVERSTATRIYPLNTYPVRLKIIANEDFSGIIKDFVPASFRITKSKNNAVTSYDTIAFDQAGSDKSVLGAEIFNIGKPFRGEHALTLGFGRQHKDPLLWKKYTAFGVVGHDGVDFDMPMGTTVIAVDKGEVVRAENSDYGNTVVIQHSWGKSYYGHLDKFLVGKGDIVEKGKTIALSGNSGLSSGPHLHFGIKPEKNDDQNGYFGKVNPLPMLELEDDGAEHGKVAGVSTSSQAVQNGVQVISWEVSLKKGQTIELGYDFDAPDISPELYLMGPLEMRNEQNELIFQEARHWQIAADSVVVNGGITTSEAQFGGLQRKVVYVNSNWYAFYNDGTDVFYKKSSDGITWGSAVNLDSGEDNDADNYNPSIDVTGNRYIHVAYFDDSADQVQMLTLDTNTDTTPQTSVCALTSPGAFDVTTYMVSVASFDATSALVAYSDTSAGSNVDVFEVAGLTSATCTSTDVQPGAITFGTQGSGLTAGDRPTLINYQPNIALMVYQDGSNLRMSLYDASRDEWRRNNTLIAAVSDTTYSLASNGEYLWILSQNSTTDTRLYRYPQSATGFTETSTAVDTDIGGATADTVQSPIDMDCISATDCKIVYIDALDTAAPILMFVDCDDATCSTKTSTNIDSDTGSALYAGSPRLFCPSATNCKIVYGDTLAGAAPDAVFVDCGDATCSGTAGTCTSGTRTCTIVDTDLGAADTQFRGDVFCPSDVSNDTDCKFIFFNSVDETNDAIWFADCSNAACSTRNALTSILANVNDDAADAITQMSIYCNASADCQVLYHDAVLGDLIIRDCSNSACSAANASTTIDADVGANAASVQSVTVPNKIDCSAGATDCKIVYADGSQNEFNFVDCSAAGCTSSTITKIDDTAGGIMAQDVSLDCSAGATDCKGAYVGHTTSGQEDVYFFDCDSATCDSGSVVDLSDPPGMAAVDCVGGSTDCKIVYYDAFVGTTNVPVRFADCTNDNCDPDAESLTAPWASQTNVISLSLTYDSANSDLIASIIKDASEKAYFSSTDATTIAWNSATAYDFTEGDLDNISTPASTSGTTNMGALLRQGTNIEFDLLSSGPTLDQVMRHGKWFTGGAESPFTF